MPPIGPTILLLRPHQWLKNVLIFAPIFFSGNFTFINFSSAIFAFIAFSAAASSAYCLNDLVDLAKDRAHPQKKFRPIAAGKITPTFAFGLALVLFLFAVLVGYLQSNYVLEIILLYSILQLLYTLYLKSVPVSDIILLSLLYLVRILCGVAATGIQPSSWILICTWILALMLASGKRYVEISRIDSSDSSHPTRGVLARYSPIFLRHLVTNCGAMAIISYLLWCSEVVGRGRFSTVDAFFSAIFVVNGVLCYQLKILTNSFNEDPTLGVIQDKSILFSILGFTAWMLFVIIH